MKTDLVFLEVAKKDLEASKYLLNKKLYSQSLFYLQQSIEKSVKFLGIRSNIITEKEAKNAIGHEAIEVYSRMVKEFKKVVVKFESAFKVFPKLKEISLMKELEINGLKESLDKFQKILSNKKMAWSISFSEEELQNIITKINGFRDELRGEPVKEMDAKVIKNSKEKFYEFLDVFSEINLITVKEKKKELEAITPQMINSFLKKLNLIFDLIFCYLSLLYLSIIFSPHAVRSRYPQGKFNPLKVYNQKMPLIKMLDFFIKIVEEILEKLDFIYA